MANSRRKIIAHPFKSIPQEPEDFLEKTWVKLRVGLDVVFEVAVEAISKESLYQSVIELCRHDHEAVIFGRLQERLDLFIQSQVFDLQRVDKFTFAGKTIQVWDRYLLKINEVRQIFMFLERTFMIKQKEDKYIYDLGLKLWQKHIRAQTDFIATLVTVILALIHEERAKDLDYSFNLKTLLGMCRELLIYKGEFEPLFLTQTAEFYKHESRQLVNDLTVADYIFHSERRLHEEERRCLLYLEPSSRKPCVHTAETHLISDYSQALLDKGFKDLVDQNRVPELHKLFELFLRVNHAEEVKSAFEVYIVNRGTTLIAETEADNLVDKLLEMKTKMDRIQSESFQDNYSLKYAANRAWERFLNLDPNKPAELMARYIDDRMKKSSRRCLNDTEIEHLVEQVIGVFRMIQAKDVFEAFFCKRLAKRLLLETSISFDAEKSIVIKLKGECGAQFTSRISGMLKDIALSKDMMDAFRVRYGQSDIDFHVFLLTGPMWPAQAQMYVKLHPDLQRLQDEYQDLYISKNRGKKLKWNSTISNCVLRTFLGSARRELSVSLHQAAVLLLFNGSQSLSFADVVALTGLPEEEAKREVVALSCMKYKILSKTPSDKAVRLTDRLEVNTSFVSRHVRIAINSVQMKESVLVM